MEKIRGALYAATLQDFHAQSDEVIMGMMVEHYGFELTPQQRNAWAYEINLLRQATLGTIEGMIAFEFDIPRLGRRIDALILQKGRLALLEFKVGSDTSDSYALAQVEDYALDLRDFHQGSRDISIMPVLVPTAMEGAYQTSRDLGFNIEQPWVMGAETLVSKLMPLFNHLPRRGDVEPHSWLSAPYKPSRGIVQAACDLYHQHGVADLNRTEADTQELTVTTQALLDLVHRAHRDQRKVLALVTGVPGAGKTLVGLNVAIAESKGDVAEHAVYLSGNVPLVEVVQEALARDDIQRGASSSLDAARRKTWSFLQPVHHFRNSFLHNDECPLEHVVVFDEAQRAWDSHMVGKFLRKQGYVDEALARSEPQLMIQVMDRHQDWAVLVGLIGSGQEINVGEAGVGAWLEALAAQEGWHLACPCQLRGQYERFLRPLEEVGRVTYLADLHLATSQRAYRSEQLSDFVAALVDGDLEGARRLYATVRDTFPLYFTRSMDLAKCWVKDQVRGNQRYGIVASSGARRFRAEGYDVTEKIDAPMWFLNPKVDVRSSYALESVASEFFVQGLELDWTLVFWGANYRYQDRAFECFSFKGTKWMRVRTEQAQEYLKNVYRVLLTRARQGMIIYLPLGSDEDHTRAPEYYEGTAQFLKAVGIEELK